MSADIPIDDYVRLLKPAGVVVNVGLPPAPYSIRPGALIGGNKAVAGSQIGGIAETQEMLDFCAEHGIAATIEVVDAADVDAVWDRVVDGDVRYRAVIDTSTITPPADTRATTKGRTGCRCGPVVVGGRLACRPTGSARGVARRAAATGAATVAVALGPVAASAGASPSRGVAGAGLAAAGRRRRGSRRGRRRRGRHERAAATAVAAVAAGRAAPAGALAGLAEVLDLLGVQARAGPLRARAGGPCVPSGMSRSS